MSGHVYCYHYTTCANQDNERSCVLLPLHYLYKATTMSGHAYCYHYTTCKKPGTMSGHVYCYHYTTCARPAQWAVMRIVTITLPVQSQDNERSCVLLPLHYLYKVRTMSGHMYCYHYTTCTKPGKWAVMCIVAIKLPVQSQDNERSCVLLR